jgi:hypothetical protein
MNNKNSINIELPVTNNNNIFIIGTSNFRNQCDVVRESEPGKGGTK